MDIVGTIISLISGAVGGNLTGAAMSEKNLGPLVNTVAGLIGGGAGEFILKAFGIISTATAGGGGELDISHILSSIAAGGGGGAAVTALITAFKDFFKK